MKENGWYAKQGVKILEGKWQDFIDSPELSQMGGFDIVYTDTFSEDYQALRQFFEHLPNLLSDGDSRFSFFNGLGSNQLVRILVTPCKFEKLKSSFLPSRSSLL
jgi:protein arginine N-methyltransferase 2